MFSLACRLISSDATMTKTTRARRELGLATEYFRMLAPGEWSIRGAGAMYGGPMGIPMNPKLRAILEALKAAGIRVSRECLGSPANADTYTFSAQFDDGGISIET